MLEGISVAYIGFLIVWRCCKGLPIDNGVAGQPIVQCSTTEIIVRVATRRPFSGRVFVKGMSRFSQCSHDYSTDGPLVTNRMLEMRIPLGNCEMKRNRMLQPHGIQQSLTVIVSFHPVFITKVDRAFNLRCFFMSTDRFLTHGFQVSMLATRDIYDTVELPDCEYTVRRDDLNGPLVHYATVGEKLYHSWKCRTDGSMAMLVRSCVIEDGGRLQFIALDTDGYSKSLANSSRHISSYVFFFRCPTDLHVMGSLVYNGALDHAFVETHAFKFADEVNVFFKCEITLCNKNPADQLEESCTGITPPNCNGRGLTNSSTSKRSANFLRQKRSLSVLSDPIPGVLNTTSSSDDEKRLIMDVSPMNNFIVLDPIDTTPSSQSNIPTAHEKSTGTGDQNAVSAAPVNGVEPLQSEWAYVTAGFAILACLVVLSFLLTAGMMVLVCDWQQRRSTKF